MGEVPRVTTVHVLDGYTVRLSFQDGTVGTVDLAGLRNRGGVFEPLHDPDYFRRVRVDEELGTIVWPNGVDLDPCGLQADALPALTAAEGTEPPAAATG